MANEAEPLVTFDQPTLDYARNLVLSCHDASTITEKEEGTNTIAGGLLAFGSLFLACCVELNVPPGAALQAANELVGFRPPSTMVH